MWLYLKTRNSYKLVSVFLFCIFAFNSSCSFGDKIKSKSESSISKTVHRVERNFCIFWLGLYGNTWQMICGALVDRREPARTKQNSRNEGALRTKKHLFLLLCHVHEPNMHLNIFLCCHIINKCSFNIFLCLFNFPQNKANTSSGKSFAARCLLDVFLLFAQHEHGWKPQFSLRLKMHFAKTEKTNKKLW